MKKSILIAALLALLAAPAANATVIVWFELLGSSTNGGLDPDGSPGGPGASLDLACDPSLNLRCDWMIAIMAANDTVGQAGWGLDLGTLPSDTINHDKLLLKQYIPGTNDPFPLEAAPALNGPGGLLLGAGAAVNPPLTSGYAPVALGTFLLSKLKVSPGDRNSVSIFAAMGAAEFGGNDNTGYEMVAVGPNGPARGNYPGQPWHWNGQDIYGYGAYPNYILPEAVIRIRNVPEPATIGALGFGLLCLVRRRK